MERATRWMAVTATIAVVAACGGDDDEANDSSTTIADPPSATSEPAAATNGSAATTVTSTDISTATAPTSDPASAGSDASDTEPAEFIDDAALLTKRFSPVDPGTHRVDTVGTPLTFTTTEPWFVQPNNQGIFVLTDPASRGPDDRDIVFLRLSELSDPERPRALPAELGDGWPAADVAGWIEALGDEVVVSDVTETTLGGLPATSFDLVLGDHGCSRSDPFCTVLGTNHGLRYKDLNPGSQYRVWIVDQDEHDPLAVIVGIDREADEAFFDRADSVLSTLAFGEVGPNPVSRVGPGPVELAMLGGIRIELDDDLIAYRDPVGGGGIASGEDPGDTEFVLNPATLDGQPFESTDDLVAGIEDASVEITEIDPTTIDGLDARVFDIGASRDGPLFLRSPDTELDWISPPRGRIWLVEHPDRGLLMITAEVFADPDEVFPIILAQTESIIDSLEFIDPG